MVDIKEQDKNPLEVIWEGLVSGIVNLFKNHPRDRFGTQIPFSGRFDNPQVGIWRTIVNVFKNAFVSALPHRIEESINPDTVEKMDKKE